MQDRPDARLMALVDNDDFDPPDVATVIVVADAPEAPEVTDDGDE